MKKNAKIYVAGHRGLVGSALVKILVKKGYTNIITQTHINQFQFESVYKIILKTQDLKLINYLLQISVSFYNYNPIFEMILSHGYSWFDQSILTRSVIAWNRLI